LGTQAGVQALYGQATDGNLVGTVVDPSGAAVPGADVQVENTTTGVKSEPIKTNPSGEYRFNNLLAGAYTLTVTKDGFKGVTLQGINVQLNKTSTANVNLEISAVGTIVEVREAAALIDTTTSQIMSTFTARESIDVPSATLPLGTLNLALNSAGVASSGGIGLGDGPVVGGQRPRNNNFMVEGVDNNRKDTTGHQINIPNEATMATTILQNQYTAEFGGGSGGQFNQTIRGGGNEVHGAVFEYLQNRNLNAVDESAARQGIRSNPRYDQNTLGGAVGGPIIKNKLFYYGLFQYNPTGQAGTSTPLLSPTAAGYSTLVSIPSLSQTNLKILQQYLAPAPSGTSTTTVAGKTIPIGILPVTLPSFTNIYSWLVSMDYNISSRDQLRGRDVNELHSGFDTSTLPALPAFFQGRTTNVRLFTLSEFHIFTSGLLNEFRFGYNRYNDVIPAGNYAYPGLDAFPNIVIQNDLNAQLGPYPNAPQSTILNTYQLIDNVSWTKGQHTFKFGWEGRKYIASETFTQRTRGDYEYSTLERFLLDQGPDVLNQRNVGAAPYSGNTINQSFFITDQYRMRSNFTVNAGVRYEYKGVTFGDKLQSLNAIASVPGLLTFNAPEAQKNGFAPRIGLAWSPGNSGRTSVRAGFGMAYDKTFDNLGLNNKPPELSQTVDLTKNQSTLTNYLASGAIRQVSTPFRVFATAADARAATSNYINEEQIMPYSLNWNMEVQHVWHEDYTIDVRYLGTRGVHLPMQSQFNIQAPVTATNALPTFLTAPSAATLAGLTTTLGSLETLSNVLPQYQPFFPGLITAFPFAGNSTYHGLATEFSKRFSKGLLFKAAYTWSHLIDDSTADLNSTSLSPRRPQDFQNFRAERSTSFLDRRHRFTYTSIYDTPWYKGSRNWILKNILGNYTASGTYTYESPQFATVQSGVDSNLNGDSAPDRTIVNANGVPNTGSAVNPIDKNGNVVKAGSAGIVGYVAQNPNAEYIAAGLGAYANGGRQTIALRPINNFDIQLKKAFALGEMRRLEFSAQFFNTFNHPQYIAGYLDYVQFRKTTATRNNLIPGNTFFNRPDLVYSSNPRNVQLALRLQF
jgi:3D (Asp-Asp-Asp) domain-containing protein